MNAWARAGASWLAGSAAALAAVAAIGYWPTARWAGPGGLRALGAGCAIAAFGALVGSAPVLIAVARGGGQAIGRPHVVAGWSMALRFGMTLAGLLVVALGYPLPRTPLAIGVAAAYGALLVVETRWMLRWLGAGAGR